MRQPRYAVMLLDLIGIDANTKLDLFLDGRVA
jgi:hypothetical protein